MTKILHVSTLTPQHLFETSQIIEAAKKFWFPKMDPRTARLALKVFENAEIDRRASVVPLDIIFGDLSFEEKNNIYKEKMIELGSQVLKKAIQESGIDPQRIEVIITTSCTGFMIPSVDAYMINELGLKKSIIRLPVTEMGCAGGTSGLIYGHQIMEGWSTGKKSTGITAVVSVELPSITFQNNDFSAENLISTAIFADGASCVLMGETDEIRPAIIDTDMYHFPLATYLMGYRLLNSGLKIVLDRDVPESINKNFPEIVSPFLEKNGLKIGDIDHFILHPGGKKIIQRVENFLSGYGKDVSDSLHVLRNNGNMSSSTVLFILERFMRKNIGRGEKGYMLAFGPGFSAQSLILEWK